MISINNEGIAVGRIAEMCNKTDNLQENLSTNDKGVTFDGNITYYKGKSNIVDNYQYETPVQVKSVQVDNFLVDYCKYNKIERNHIVNYNRRGGCLVFVVEIDKDGNTKEFFKSFLPVDIRRLLSETKAINPTIKYNHLASKEHLVDIIDLMTRNMKLQHYNVLPYNSDSIKELMLSPTEPFNPQTFTLQDLFKFNIYAHSEIEKNIFIPIDTMVKFKSRSLIMRNHKISIGDRNFVVDIVFRQSEIEDTLTIDNILNIRLSKTNENAKDVNFTLKGENYFTQLKNVISLLSHFFKIGEIRSESFDIKIDSEQSDLIQQFIAT